MLTDVALIVIKRANGIREEDEDEVAQLAIRTAAKARPFDIARTTRRELERVRVCALLGRMNRQQLAIRVLLSTSRVHARWQRVVQVRAWFIFFSVTKMTDLIKRACQLLNLLAHFGDHRLDVLDVVHNVHPLLVFIARHLRIDHLRHPPTHSLLV